MHGLKNEPMPARKETPKLNIVSELMPPPIDVTKLSDSRMSVRNSRFATRDNVPVKTKTPSAIRTMPKKY